jgi:uncharacterized protein (TIGR02145 family)
MKKLLLYLFAFTAIVACSKDDSPETQPTTPNGGDVLVAEVVTIDLPGETLSSAEYTGKFGGVDITLEKTDDKQLTFLVPEGTPGLKDLEIAALGVTIPYNVIPTVLPGTPEETIAPLVSGLESFAVTLDGSTSPEAANLQNNLDSFNNYLENATEEDKMQLAIAYHANKELIDQVIANDFSNAEGRITWDDKVILIKFLVAVSTIKIGSTLAVKGWHPKIKALGIVIAGIATTASLDFYVQFIQKEVKELGITINSLTGENDRNANNTELIFTNDISKTLPITTSRRKITTADSNSTVELVADFFDARGRFNTAVNKVNEVIQYINDNVPFVSFGLMQTADLSATATPSNVATTSETFGKFQFSVNHPNLTLVNATHISDGQIAVRIKITGTPTTLPVESFLYYTYTDEFSTYTGKFPIKVSTELLCGTVTDIDGNTYPVVAIGEQCWTAHNLNVSHYRNGDPIPQITNDQDWLNATGGAWCYYANNTENGVIYGKLYNWYAVNDPRGLAPEGYHIPSQDEWMQMKDFLGGYMVAGGPLKSTEHWQAPNVGATNETGFSAVPGSQRNGAFYADGWGVVGVYWSSTSNPDDDDNEEAWSNTMSRSSAGCSHYQGSWKKVGMSVRCVKD